MQASLRSRQQRVDVILWALAGSSAVLILWLSFGPGFPPGATMFPGADKVQHGLAYFVMALLFLLAAVWRPGRGAGPWFGYRWFLVLAVIGVGGVVEIGQSALTATRQAEVLDWVAEILAVLAAYGVVSVLRVRSEAA